MSTITIPGILILKGNKTYGRLLSKDNQANLLEGRMQTTDLKNVKTVNLKDNKTAFLIHWCTSHWPTAFRVATRRLPSSRP